MMPDASASPQSGITVALDDAEDDVEDALEQQVPADQQGEDAEGLERRGQRHDAGDDEQHTEHGVQPLAAPRRTRSP